MGTLRRRLSKLEGNTNSIAALSDAEMDLCIERLLRLAREEQGEIVESHTEDAHADNLIARIHWDT